MTTKSYSQDLRIRVIEYIKKGNPQNLTAQLFNLSTSTVNRWWIQYKNNGAVAPKDRGGSKGKIDPDNLAQFVEANGDKTLSEISRHFNASICSIYIRLKKLGFSYKKKLSPMWKRR